MGYTLNIRNKNRIAVIFKYYQHLATGSQMKNSILARIGVDIMQKELQITTKAEKSSSSFVQNYKHFTGYSTRLRRG